MNTQPVHAPFSRLTIFLLLCLFVAAAGVYLFYALPYPKWWPFYNNYARLGDAFLHGQTYLRAAPSFELLSLLNPYEPRQREGVDFIWDAALYQGKYYFYFGPLPALFWCLIYMLTGHSMSDLQLSAMFAIFGTGFLVLLLAAVAQHLRSKYTAIALIFCAASLCFGTWMPFVLRRSAIYETAILGGYCFNALGLLLLWHGMTKKKFLLLGLASFCFGLAMCSRLSQGMNLLILGVAAFMIVTNKVKMAKLPALLCLALPWLVCMEALWAYNYVRFGDPFDSGWRYTLAIPNQNTTKFRPLQPEKFIANMYFYFFRPLEFTPNLQFPFFHVNISPYGVQLFGTYYATTVEAVYGIFTNSPFSLWFLACPLIWLRRKHINTEVAAALWPATLFSFAAIAFLSVFFYTVQRYSLDMTPWLMFTSSLLYLLVLQLAPEKYKLPLLVLGGCMALWGVATGLFAGCYRMPFCTIYY